MSAQSCYGGRISATSERVGGRSDGEDRGAVDLPPPCPRLEPLQAREPDRAPAREPSGRGSEHGPAQGKQELDRGEDRVERQVAVAQGHDQRARGERAELKGQEGQECPVVGGELALGTWQSIALVDVNIDNATRTVRLSFLS